MSSYTWMSSYTTSSDTIRGVSTMSASDKAENTAEDLKGKAKEAAGRVTHDDSQVAEGKADQAKADMKKAGENVKDAFKH
jgi:uncharacterized protein YjbJ (UPF0337 family)